MWKCIICLNILIVHMGDSGMRYFCSKLQQQPKQQMSQVKDIDLQSIYNQFLFNLANDLTSHGINIFCNSLPLFPNLERLEIGINPIELSGIRELSYYLHLIPKLQKLGLGGCNIGDNGIEQLSSYFKDISQLELLNIQNNGITDKGVEIFCKYIDNLPKLFELSLQENELSNNGIELVGESIMKCMELQVLSYYDNKMNNGEDVRFEIRQNHPNKEMCIYVYEDEIHAELDKEVEDTLRGLE